ncbi:hypothetical protein U2F26_13685 [Micromonospora sp. 4G57]|uniref:Uncharacterized protein n=1 Tax=Micromonospora sicca TaxID=2202420 RepID=A0ABU5JAU5_9ACTN|nr:MULTISPECIES: hypothetical protein [unclassified Micromonospora]MDZ5443775.1 hypothetical protein [Micromonospora sp. 4G57]MDZ5489707.1 hypothetical protein [Micromonospora sp. 4G53]
MSRQTAADRRFERRGRVAKLRHAVDKMAQRQALSEFNNGMWSGLGDQDKSQRYWRAARRQRKAFWRLLDALEAEAAR